jgi:hypothetical protein
VFAEFMKLYKAEAATKDASEDGPWGDGDLSKHDGPNFFQMCTAVIFTGESGADPTWLSHVKGDKKLIVGSTKTGSYLRFCAWKLMLPSCLLPCIRAAQVTLIPIKNTLGMSTTKRSSCVPSGRDLRCQTAIPTSPTHQLTCRCNKAWTGVIKSARAPTARIAHSKLTSVEVPYST